MARIYYDIDTSLSELQDSIIGIIGYGNQGRAQALNLRDSGLSVRVAARDQSPSGAIAIKDGFETESIERVAANCDVLAIMLPDEVIADVYKASIEPYLTSGRSFVFAHGFAIHNKIVSLPDDADIILVAPTGPGRKLRSLYIEGKGLPALVAVAQNGSGRAFEKCLSYALGIGSTRAGVIETTFSEETVTDLFCEQSVLCGGVPALIKASFDTLVESGYQPELAYISCLKEVKLIADLLFERGIDGMRESISTTAQYGSALAGEELVDDRTRHKLKKILRRIETGEFARSFLATEGEREATIENLLASEKRSRLARTGKDLQTKIQF
ncbi:MAG: ketol-acid reductoisomerase [Candidatus Melainabacteria bacterium]|nr:ketol-acid reductoisomerase [Candidatus Melainabacteria bacterium]